MTMLVLRRLPAKWRTKDCARHMSEFCRDFLRRFFTICREIQGERKKMITKDVAMLALTSMGFTKMFQDYSLKSHPCKKTGEMIDCGRCITKNGIQSVIQETKVTLTVKVRLFIRRVLGGVVHSMTQYARVLEKPISVPAETVIGSLRRRMWKVESAERQERATRSEFEEEASAAESE